MLFQLWKGIKYDDKVLLIIKKTYIFCYRINLEYGHFLSLLVFVCLFYFSIFVFIF